tara:strand:+ start:171 stop:395 length:225 start_codon:yes stop_codon:yes gene_type:complete
VEKLFDKKIFSNLIKKSKLVDGLCPYCTQHVLLVSIVNDYFRCMNCGGDIEQKINGKISYLPVETPVNRPKVDG